MYQQMFLVKARFKGAESDLEVGIMTNSVLFLHLTTKHFYNSQSCKNTLHRN